ncbi:hypothetical protein VDGD_10416 [Verticillium dahliae]|uniref:Enhancer of mRNA-decapping protein 3 n=1 Tax=Verticillium dahliae (strain VdLs.17 / ATCC MYA-4575 / FGSC 10137) TaxID=498257 RepID=G2XJT4_VERDV|nr:uncharacterized protein VDAG_10416 [Verticillium dahliae VdLs.17]EGY20787.1 hypothetical protein VDAG_10416 [Verticillium dahliae VdLs.17]KAH6708057.1 YjeF-related protein N-terminus-domain-containing protein [Verticillium dahliae]RBQ89807.1 hypothetical protein VDGD_10416 [Verticillium dahliae]
MDFIGLQMLVTVKDPPGVRVKGTVSEVTPGQSLVLSNVFHLGSSKWIPRLTLEPNNIVDLAEYKDEVTPETFTAPGASSVPAPVLSQPALPSFTDPAIVSLGRRPGSGSQTPVESRPQSRSQPRPQSRRQSPPMGELERPPTQPGGLSIPSIGHVQRRESTKANLATEHEDLRIHNESHRQDLNDYTTPGTADAPLQAPKKRNRRARPNKALKNGTAEDASLEASLPQGGRGKGWRQTPMLQSTSSFQPFKALKRNGKAGNGVLDNGWASEDVTEEMGEFDFEGELAKFDKQTIFNQMQKDDLVEESDRLVSHNRKAKPGTAGGKNYHHTENVLDIPAATPKMANDFWDSETDDAALGPERLSGRDVRSSQSMRRTDSNRPNAGKRSQSRKASASGIPPTSRANLASQPGFYLVPSQRRAEPVSALQMLNLENIAANEIGLTEDMMTENAGRGIAEVAVAALCDPAIQIRLGAGGISASAISHTSSIIVVLAGNNKSGIRAVAAARHLGNKGVSVLVCVVGIERERDLLEDMRQQVRIFKNLGGRIHNKIELFEQLRKTSHSSSATVTLIIDALLGLAISFEELRTGDQATVYELIEWANRNEAFTLAVDVPTGIDPSTGKVSIIDGGRLYVKPRYVVAMGAPKRGLLEAMAPPLRPSEEGNPKSLSAPAADNDDWKLFIIDIGLGAAVWKKAGTKLRRGIDFDDKWVLEMRYQGATGQGEEPDY